jgi:hypothetical protein
MISPLLREGQQFERLSANLKTSICPPSFHNKITCGKKDGMREPSTHSTCRTGPDLKELDQGQETPRFHQLQAIH